MIRYTFCAIILFLFTYGIDVIGQNAEWDQIDSVIYNTIGNNSPAYGIMLINEDSLVAQRNYGYINIEKEIPAHSNTLYHLSYLAKQDTAYAILKGEELGKLSLNDKVSAYLDDFPAYGSEVRIVDLLNHTSGLPNYWKELGYEKADKLTQKDVYDYIKNQNKLNFEAGTKFSVSYSDYAILYFVIEEVSGSGYHKFLEKEFFDPLNMKHTYVHHNEKPNFFQRLFNINTNKEVITHSFRRDSVNSIINHANSKFVLGLEGIYTTISDYVKFEQALYEMKVISKENYDKVFTRARLDRTADINTKMGYGWINDRNNYMHYYYIFGADLYNTNMIMRFPDLKTSVLILTKRNGVFGLRKLGFRLVNKYSRIKFMVK